MTETPHPQTPPTQAADTQSPRSGRPARPARVALVTAALAAVMLAGLWLVRTTPWAADVADTGSGRGIAEPGLTLYPAGERDPAAPLRGRTLDGTAFDLEELEGQIVVLNVWGSWCGPCVAETPGLVRVANKTADRGVQFVGIDTRDERASANAFAKNYKVPYPSVFDLPAKHSCRSGRPFRAPPSPAPSSSTRTATSPAVSLAPLTRTPSPPSSTTSSRKAPEVTSREPDGHQSR